MIGASVYHVWHVYVSAPTVPHISILIGGRLDIWGGSNAKLGQGEILEADVFTISFPQTGYLMLCSDGLWGVVAEKDMLRVIQEAPDLQQACQNLVEAANTAGGPDNISVVIAQLIG